MPHRCATLHQDAPEEKEAAWRWSGPTAVDRSCTNLGHGNLVTNLEHNSIKNGSNLYHLEKGHDHHSKGMNSS